MIPTIGRIVHYTLTSGDAEVINRRRDDADAFRRNLPGIIEAGERGRTGHIEHFGNYVAAGDAFPAVIVRTFGETTANLKVLLDGNDDYWATSCAEGHGFGHWAWPVIEVIDAGAGQVIKIIDDGGIAYRS